jgi:hypothetical protein
VIKADGSIALLRQGSSASRHARLQILPAIMKKLDGNPAQRFHIRGRRGVLVTKNTTLEAFTMSFRIAGLPAKPFAPLFDLTDEDREAVPSPKNR